MVGGAPKSSLVGLTRKQGPSGPAEREAGPSGPAEREIQRAESTGGERVSGGSKNAAGEFGVATDARRRVARGCEDISGWNDGDSGSNTDLDPVAGPEEVKGAPAASGAPPPEILIK